MFSLFSPKAPSSTRRVATPETDSGTLSRLIRENQQLRRELEDAHYRIRELEAASFQVWLQHPASAGDEDDGSSIEVQSVDNGLSVTSSTTTIPTGSSLANQYRARQQKRDEFQQEKALRTKRLCNKIRNDPKAEAQYLLSKYRDPYGELARRSSSQISLLQLSSVREDVVPDDCSLPFLMSSSVSTCSDISQSAISERSGEVSSDLSRVDGLPGNNTRNKVAASAMGYLARIGSTDSESSSKDEDYIEI